MTDKTYLDLDERELVALVNNRTIAVTHTLAVDLRRLRQLYDARKVLDPEAFSEGIRILLERNGQ